MADALEQVLLELGLDLSPVKEAGKVVAATMADLNRLTDQYQSKASAAGEAQLSKTRQLAQAAIQGAMAAIAEEKKKQAVLESQTGELQKQLAQQKINSENVIQSISAEEKKLKILQQQTEQRKAELLELQRTRAEERRGGGREGGEEERFLRRFGGALMHPGGVTTLAAEVTGGVIGGELAAQAIEKIIDKLKEVTKEAGSITLLENQFRALARGAGQDADKMLQSMTEHTEGLISRFTILQTASAALKSNLVAPEKVAEAMGAVVKLAESQGKSAEQGIQALNRALLTGRGYALAMATGMSMLQARLSNLPQGLTATQRATTQLNMTLDMIIRKAKELGETPQTFEQMEKRLATAVKNITIAFGEGINASAGAQVFLSMFNMTADKMGDLEVLAKKVGKSVGDAFGGIATMLEMLGPVVASLWQTFKNLVDIVLKLAGSATGFDQIRTATTKTRQEFEQAHPILVKVVSAFALMVGLTQKIVDNVASFVASLKEHETLIKMLGAAAIVAMGPEVAIGAGLIGMGIKRGAFQPRGEEGNQGTEYGANIPSTMRKYNEGQRSMLAHGPGTPQDWEDRLIEQMKHFQDLLDKADTTVVKQAGQGLGNQENLALQRKAAQQLLQLRIEFAKQRLEEEKSTIQYEQEMDDEAYAEGEEKLSEHLRKQLELARQNLQAQQGLAREDYQAKVQKAAEDFEIVRKQYAGIGQPVSADERKAYEMRVNTLFEAYVNQTLAADRTFESKRTQIHKQGEADRQAATLKGIQDQLAAERESIQSRQQLLEKSFGNEQIDPEAYYQKRIELIQEEAMAETNAAIETYATKKKNEESLAQLRASLRAAQQKGDEAIDRATEDRVKNQIDSIKKQYGSTQQLATAQFGVAAALGNTENQRQVAQGGIANLESYRASLVAMLPTLTAYPKLYSDVALELEQITNEQIKWNEEIVKTPEHIAQIGQGLSSVGTAIGSTFHQRFTQNLAASIAASAALTSPERSAQLAEGIAGYKGGQKITGTMDKFVTQITSSVTALTGFVDALMTAKTAVAGGVGGAIAGAGFGQTVGSAIGKIAGLGSMAGPWGAVAGAAVGGIAGIFTGSKQAEVKRNIDQLNTTFKDVMMTFGENTNNLQQTIIQLENLIQQVREMQASSKKGSSQYQDLINQYSDQLHQLQVQQIQTLRDLRQQVAILQEPTGAQGYLTDLKSILNQYQQFEGAAQTTQDLADATRFLVESMQSYEQNLESQLLQDNQQAVNDALQLNDLLWQRNQMIIEYNQQVSQVLSAGVLTRQMTRAQTAGTQIYQLQQQHERQMEQINEQINATNFRVQAEQQIFNLATTRVGLETQLLTLQNQQTGFDMLRIAALSALVQQLQTGNLGAGTLGQLLQSLQGVTVAVPGAGGASTGWLSNTDIVSQLEQSLAAAYQDRASLGYGVFRAQNL